MLCPPANSFTYRWGRRSPFSPRRARPARRRRPRVASFPTVSIPYGVAVTEAKLNGCRAPVAPLADSQPTTTYRGSPSGVRWPIHILSNRPTDRTLHRHEPDARPRSACPGGASAAVASDPVLKDGPRPRRDHQMGTDLGIGGFRSPRRIEANSDQARKPRLPPRPSRPAAAGRTIQGIPTTSSPRAWSRRWSCHLRLAPIGPRLLAGGQTKSTSRPPASGAGSSSA